MDWTREAISRALRTLKAVIDEHCSFADKFDEGVVKTISGEYHRVDALFVCYGAVSLPDMQDLVRRLEKEFKDLGIVLDIDDVYVEGPLSMENARKYGPGTYIWIKMYKLL